MKSKIIILTMTIFLILLPIINAFSEEENKVEGDVSVKGVLVDVDGNEAKFNEYRDVKSGVYGKIRVGLDIGNYYIKLKASDIGYNTQNYMLNGGMWGKFKYNLFYKEIPHNFTFDAKSFYSGIGTNNLTGAPNTNVSTWNTFDYSIKRKQYGGGFQLDILKPLYFDLSASREDRSGIRPNSATWGATSGPIVELPEPVDYKTNTFKADVGYAKKPFFASLSYLYSDFSNSNHFLNFRDDGTTNIDKLTLPPDNQYYKLAFKGSVDLPMHSKFNVNLASSSAKANANLLTSYLVSGAPTAVNNNGVSVFDGKVKTQNYAFVLSSNPVSFLNGKIFYKYYDKKNESDEITETVGANNYTNELFDYHKNNFGVELGFKVPAHLYFSTAYSYLKVNREFAIMPETVDNVYAADLKWNGLDFMTAKVGYERLERDGKADWTAINALTGDSQVERFKQRSDIGTQDRDTYKASLDLYPFDDLSLGLGYKHRKSDYKDTVLGLRDDKRDEYSIDADYALAKIATLNAYFEYEKIKTYQYQRRFDNGAALSVIDPNSSTQNATNYNWDVTQTNKSYNYGLGTDIYILPKKLTLRAQYDYLDSDGSADFTYYAAAALTAGRNNDNIDIVNWDDYKKSAFMTKAIYDVTKFLAVSLGYAYEHYKYNDAALDGYPASYIYTVGATNHYLTGLYKDQSYNANVIFAAVTYKF